MMEGHKSSEGTYVLGNHPEELARLDRQAAAIDRPTRLLLQAARITPGTRVLDLGTGLGHVAQIAGSSSGRQAPFWESIGPPMRSGSPVNERWKLEPDISRT